MTDSVPVNMQVLGIELVPGAGRVLALANVAIEVAGFSFTMQGIGILRRPDGVDLEGPQWRHPRDGRHLPAVLLPGDLRQVIADQVMAEVTRRHRDAVSQGEGGSAFASWSL